VQLTRLTLNQLDFDLGHRRTLASGADLAGVEAERSARAIGEFQRLRRAANIGHEHRSQPPGRHFEDAAPGSGRQLAGVDARVRHGPLVFGPPVQGADRIACAFDGLQPAPSAPAHAQRDSGLAQLPGAGVVVGADVVRGAGAPVDHRGERRMLAHLRQQRSGYRQLEFDFRGHDRSLGQ
jgi:hypothetical protein